MKFAVIKKKVIITVMLLCVSVVLCVFLLTKWSEPASAVPKLGKTVVIDAGHGGIDGGVAGSVTGVREADINLAIAKSLKHFFERNGYDVVMTRVNENGLYDKGASSKKLSDMQARQKIIEKAAPALVVSVHQNYYPLSSVKGAQVFYSAESEDGKTVAESMQKTLNGALSCERVAKTGDYYILNCTQYPSVIAECGFLSNAEEESKLVRAEYQEKIAYSIFSAAHEYLTGDEVKCEHN